MLSTVGFNDEARFHTSKVYHVERDRMQSSEPPADLVSPERIPKQPLRFRRVPTQTASASDHRSTASHPPNLRLSGKLPQLRDRGKSGEPPPWPSPHAGEGSVRRGFCIVVAYLDRVSSQEQCRTGEA